MIRLTLNCGEVEINDIVEEGGWVIKAGDQNVWNIYEVPLYGGDERLCKTFPNYELDAAISYCKKTFT